MSRQTELAVEDLRAAIIAQGPTDQQCNAIFAEDLEFLLRASPGSGKTWTSCRRFIWRAANWSYPVGGLALLSFTNVAIREFKGVTIDVGRSDLLSDPNYVGTFDSFVERYIISPFGHLLTGATKRLRLFPGPRPGDWNNKRLKVWSSGKGGRKIPIPAWELVPYLDDNKARFRSSRAFGQRPLGDDAKQVAREFLSLGFYTHGQRVFWACKLLFARPHLAKLLARRFPEIIVDEAQDSNAWLLVLLNILRDEGAKITLIGDPDQCIYEFSMADSTSLPTLKKKWGLPERPLSRSFRCNNQIARAASSVSGNRDFTGTGNAENGWRRGFIAKETSEAFSDSLTSFYRLTARAEVGIDSSAIICRAHGQLEALSGKANFTRLRGKTKDLASAAFLRDSRHDFRGASQAVEKILRELTGDDPLWERLETDTSAAEQEAVGLAIWKFVKNPDLLIPVASGACHSWIDSMRTNMQSLIDEIGVQCDVSLPRHIKSTGLPAEQKELPLFESTREHPTIRQDTIHQVKGESIDAVLVVGSKKFWDSVVAAVKKGNNNEDRRLAYVAMTRARHLLTVALPQSHFNKHRQTWVDWGFEVAP